MRREYLYYVLLVALFVLASVYQARFSYSAVQSLMRSSEQIRWPLNAGRFSTTVSGVAPEAEEAGLRVGDVLLEVNGRAYTGREVLYDAYYDTRPGDVLRVKVRHQQVEGAAAEEELQIQVQPVTDFATSIGNWVYVLVLYVLMPVICVLLGFGVAVLKPREVNAWLLLALMLSFVQILAGFDPLLWKGWLRDVMVLYQSFFQTSWPIWMMLLGIYFPERLGLDRRFPWMKWILIVPNAFFVVADMVVALGALKNNSLAAQLAAATRPLEPVATAVSMINVGIFFAAIGYKSSTATSPDARRRLRLLQIGSSSISLTPILQPARL